MIVAAPSSGSWKTLITLASLRALKNAGLRAASAKLGPDYIVPRFHEPSSDQPCVHLDARPMRKDLIPPLLVAQADGAYLVIVEGVMGLFDGPDKGKGSTADFAKELGLPVVLVVDASHQSQSVAALVHGFATFR